MFGVAGPSVDCTMTQDQNVSERTDPCPDTPCLRLTATSVPGADA